MMAGAPGLSRAIAECTQPYGQLHASLHSLTKYLADEGSTDAAYKALILRAWTEPLSAAVVEKVASILKQCLLRHTPSLDVLNQIEDFCTKIVEAVQLPASGIKALHYVRACIKRLRKNDPVSPNLSRFPSFQSAKPWQNESEPVGVPQAVSPGTSMQHLSAASSMDPLPAMSRPEAPGLPATVSITMGDGTQEGLAGELIEPLPSFAEALMMPNRLSTDFLLLKQQGGVETWAVPSPGAELRSAPDTLPSLSAASSLAPPSAAWLTHLPDLNPSLSGLAPAPAGFQVAKGGKEAPVVSVDTVVKCVLDVDDSDLVRHLLEVSEAVKAEAQQPKFGTDMNGVEPSPLPVTKDGRGLGRVAGAVRGRAMFHHQPYNEQEALNMGEADVAAVVEVVCGRAAVWTVMPRSQDEEGAGTSGFWEAQYDNDGLGQVCGGILMKLIMDLWLRGGPGNSYPLVLRMLRKTLDAPQPAVRARAFDIIYNLSIHASLLRSCREGTATPRSGPHSGGGAPVGPVTPPAASHQQGSPSRLMSPSQSTSHLAAAGNRGAGAGLRAGQAAAGGRAGAGAMQGVDPAQFKAWLRALLFPLLCLLYEVGEMEELVWQAALGCMLQLTVHSGQFVKSWVTHLPLQAMSGLLRACVTFNWSQELYCHLLRLASHLLIASRELEASTAAAEASGGSVAGTSAAPPVSPRGVPASFGGLPEVLEHLARAPTAASRADLLAGLVHTLTQPGLQAHLLASALASLQLDCVSAALQAALRCPRPNLTTRMLEAVQVECPSSRAASSPEAQQLLRSFLHELEVCSLEPLQLTPQISGHIQVTLAHMTAMASSSAADLGDPASVSESWATFKELCSADAPGPRYLAVHWLHQLLLQAFHICQGNPMMLTPLNLRSSEGGKMAAAGPHQRAGTTWTALLADALLHVVRGAPGGCELLLSASLRAVADLKKQWQAPGPTSPTTDGLQAPARMVMSALYVTLLWVLQGGNASEAGSLPTIQALADHVLQSSCQPTSGGSATRAASQHVATSVLSGDLGFATDVLQSIPAELLVSLLQQCTQQSASCGDLLRGFGGRPSVVVAAAAQGTSQAAAGTGAGSEASALLWGNVILDRRLALLLALMARCSLDSDAFAKHSLAHMIRGQLLSSEDPRERYLAGVYLLNHWMLNQQDKYWRTLRQLVVQAQQLNDERLLHNPYLQICTMLSVDHAQ